MQYTVVEGQGSAEELIDNVNNLIRQGWKPLGGVAIAIPEDYSQNNWYAQAMIKE